MWRDQWTPSWFGVRLRDIRSLMRLQIRIMQKSPNCWAKDGEVWVSLREIHSSRKLKDYASFTWQSFLITNTDQGKEVGQEKILRVEKDSVETMTWSQTSNKSWWMSLRLNDTVETSKWDAQWCSDLRWISVLPRPTPRCLCTKHCPRFYQQNLTTMVTYP